MIVKIVLFVNQPMISCEAWNIHFFKGALARSTKRPPSPLLFHRDGVTHYSYGEGSLTIHMVRAFSLGLVVSEGSSAFIFYSEKVAYSATSLSRVSQKPHFFLTIFQFMK